MVLRTVPHFGSRELMSKGWPSLQRSSGKRNSPSLRTCSHAALDDKMRDERSVRFKSCLMGQAVLLLLGGGDTPSSVPITEFLLQQNDKVAGEASQDFLKELPHW